MSMHTRAGFLTSPLLLPGLGLALLGVLTVVMPAIYAGCPGQYPIHDDNGSATTTGPDKVTLTVGDGAPASAEQFWVEVANPESNATGDLTLAVSGGTPQTGTVGVLQGSAKSTLLLARPAQDAARAAVAVTLTVQEGSTKGVSQVVYFDLRTAQRPLITKAQFDAIPRPNALVHLQDFQAAWQAQGCLGLTVRVAGDKTALVGTIQWSKRVHYDPNITSVFVWEGAVVLETNADYSEVVGDEVRGGAARGETIWKANEVVVSAGTLDASLATLTAMAPGVFAAGTEAFFGYEDAGAPCHVPTGVVAAATQNPGSTTEWTFLPDGREGADWTKPGAWCVIAGPAPTPLPSFTSTDLNAATTPACP